MKQMDSETEKLFSETNEKIGNDLNRCKMFIGCNIRCPRLIGSDVQNNFCEFHKTYYSHSKKI